MQIQQFKYGLLLLILALTACQPKPVPIENLPDAWRFDNILLAEKGDKVGLYRGAGKSQEIYVEPIYDNIEWVDSIMAFIAVKGNDRFLISSYPYDSKLIVPYKCHERLDEWDLKIVTPSDSVYLYDNNHEYKGILRGPYENFVYTSGTLYPRNGELYGLEEKYSDGYKSVVPVQFRQIYQVVIKQVPTSRSSFYNSWMQKEGWSNAPGKFEAFLLEDANGKWLTCDAKLNPLPKQFQIDPEKLLNAPATPQNLMGDVVGGCLTTNPGDIYVESVDETPGTDHKIRFYYIDLCLDECLNLRENGFTSYRPW